MDPNKLKTLKDIGYKIHPCCRLCEHSKFASGSTLTSPSNWGTCKTQTYDHQKHTESKRQLSINVLGGCGKFKLSKGKVLSWLGSSWTQFVSD
jgi:hypothetical protein